MNDTSFPAMADTTFEHAGGASFVSSYVDAAQQSGVDRSEALVEVVAGLIAGMTREEIAAALVAGA